MFSWKAGKKTPPDGSSMMFNNSNVTVLTATLITTSMLSLSGCMSTFHGFAIDDPPYEGTKLGIITIGDCLSGEEGEETTNHCNIGVFIFVIVDLPFSFVLDTVRLPFDLIEISKYPKYHGQVLHSLTGEAISGVVIMAATHINKSELPLTQEQWRKQLGWRYHRYGLYGEVHRIGNQDYACVAKTRTNKNGKFTLQLNDRLSRELKGFVALKEGYKDAFHGYDNAEVSILYLIPEAD
jgi:uncharacterized protein YceK